MAGVVNPSIFRAYDIRGLVDSDLTGETMSVLGQAAGSFFRAQGGRSLAVGRDVRPSSPRFQAALIDGLRSTGIDVVDIGEVPTPVMYFAVEHLHTDGGVIISASHNPPEYNGVKLRRAHPRYGSEPLASDDIQEIRRLAQAGSFAPGEGTLRRAAVEDAYVQSVQRVLRLPEQARPRVVLDGGNGVAGPLGVSTLEAVGAEVIPLYIEPDGTFPNHHPDPLKADNLRDLAAAVRYHQAHMGIALDGDGDRLGVVDNNGTIVWADRYLIVLANYLLAQRKGPVVFDVKCSTVLIDAIRAAGGTPVMWKTGYPNLSAKMRETDAVLGGELSGHTIATYPGHYYDDGTFAGAFLLSALAHLGGGGTLSLAQALEPYPALPSLNEGRIAFPDDAKFQVVAHVRDTFAPSYPVIDIDGVRVDFGDGWGLVRASNTEPAITTRFEAATEDRVYAIRAKMLEAVEAFRGMHRAAP
jgi:phosphomannomutase